jgi:hypothetical protein
MGKRLLVGFVLQATGGRIPVACSTEYDTRSAPLSLGSALLNHALIRSRVRIWRSSRTRLTLPMSFVVHCALHRFYTHSDAVATR